MNREVSCHVLHYRSEVDDTDQPVVFSMPGGVGPLPSEMACIVLCHDTLDPPTRDRFIDVSLKEAHRWLPALRSSPEPIALLQPMSRGNGEAYGAAGRDLLDAIEAVERDQSLRLAPMYLAGLGGGGTRCLTWAGLYPEKWKALAVAGAVWDERLDPPNERHHPWEEGSLEALRPASLASNLSSMRVLVEQPWWFDGLAGTSTCRQFDEMVNQLRREKVDVTARREVPLLLGATDWPSKPAELIEWFLQAPQAGPMAHTFTAYSTRATGKGCRVVQLSQTGRPATVKRQVKDDVLSIQTTGCSDILIEPMLPKPIRLDRRRYAVDGKDAITIDGRSWIRFQHRGDRWQKISPMEPMPVLGGARSMLDLRWDGVLFVPGTLGDDLETRTLRRLAEVISQRWTLGADVPAVDETNHTCTVRYDVVDDVDVTDAMMNQKHVVVLGNARSNLVLARYHGRLECDWPGAVSEDDEDSGEGRAEPFRFRGHTYTLPDTGLLALHSHPEVSGRCLVVVTGASLQAMSLAARYRLTLCPDFLLWEGATVRMHGHWPARLALG